MHIVTDFLAYLPWRAAIGAVLDTRRHTLDWLDGEVRKGRALVWACDDAIVICELRHYPTGAKDIHALIAAGDVESIISKLVPKAEQYGRDSGCIGAVVESREGWKRALKSSGYEPYQQMLRKDL